MDEPILQRLRRETRREHESVEARVDLNTCLHSTAAYLQLLQTFYGLYYPLEREIRAGRTAILEWLPDLAARIRSDLLREDLIALGDASADQLPVAGVPQFASDAARFGCLYVLEGSSLGGQILYREVSTRLGYTARNGASFFHGYGSETGSMWKRFGVAIEAYALSHTDRHDEVISSARDVFRTFDDWIVGRLSC